MADFLIRDGGDGVIMGLLINHTPSKTNLKRLGFVADPILVVADSADPEDPEGTLSINEDSSKACTGETPAGFLLQEDTNIWRGSEKWEEYMEAMDE